MAQNRFEISCEQVDELVQRLNQLQQFPLRLSELEAFMGRPLQQYFNSESHDPSFVHDKGGLGLNTGGTPIYHSDWNKELPPVFELRSKHYARYWDRPGSAAPPGARDDPMVDLISVSARYDQRPAPTAPEDCQRFDDKTYSYLPNHYLMKSVGEGFLSLHLHDTENNRNADRWVYQISVDRGLFVDNEEVAQAEGIYLSIIDAFEAGDFEAYYTDFQEHYKDYEDYGSFNIGLRTYTIRYFTGHEGPYFSDFMIKDQLEHSLSLYTYRRGETKVALPRIFRRLGIESFEITRDVPEVAPGHADGGELYYNSVKANCVRSGMSLRVSCCGFYPYRGGGEAVPTSLSVDEFLVQNIDLFYKVMNRRDAEFL